MARYKVKGWEEVKKELFFPVYEAPLSYVNDDAQMTDVPNKAIVRADTGDLLSVVGPDYQLVKNEDVFQELYKILPSDGNVEVKNAWTSNNGGRSFLELFMGNGGKIESVGQPVGNRLIVTNSYDRSRKFGLQAGLCVLACINGMISWKTRTELASFHLKSQDIYGKIEAVASYLKIDLERTQVYSDYGTTKVIDPAKVLEAVSKNMHLPEKYEEAVFARAEKSHSNYWELYQCFTEVITHEMDSPQRRLQFEYRLDREFEKVYHNPAIS